MSKESDQLQIFALVQVPYGNIRRSLESEASDHVRRNSERREIRETTEKLKIELGSVAMIGSRVDESGVVLKPHAS